MEIKNLLNSDVLQNMKNHINSDLFAWYFYDGVSYKGDNDYFFSHTLYRDNNINSDYYKLIVLPILDKIKVKEDKLIRAKVNLYIKTNNHIKSSFHTDFDDEHKVCLFSVNTNNGYTEFENGETYKSVENSAIIFDGKLRHRSVNQTDETKRINININYSEDK